MDNYYGASDPIRPIATPEAVINNGEAVAAPEVLEPVAPIVNAIDVQFASVAGEPMVADNGVEVKLNNNDPI